MYKSFHMYNNNAHAFAEKSSKYKKIALKFVKSRNEFVPR